jgi:hypothetical protein
MPVGKRKETLVSRRTMLRMMAGTVAAPQRARREQVGYDVPLIPQPTPMSCWAAAIAMIVSWKRGELVTPLQVAERSGRVPALENGLPALASDVFSHWGMVTRAPVTFTPIGFLTMLRDYGPLWVAAQVSDPHVRVVTGYEYDADAWRGRVQLNDPREKGRKFRLGNRGSRYSETYLEFARNSERLGAADLRKEGYPDEYLYPVYFAHMRQRRK